MFSIQEIKFLSAELERFTTKIERHLHDENLEGEQRKIVERRLVTTTSIRRKLEYEKRLCMGGPKKTPRVLIIEDVESVRLLESEILNTIGFDQIDTAVNGEVGINKLEGTINTSDEFGLVLCDWEMPKMSGMDVLQKVRNHKDLWHIPFFFVTGRIQEKDMIEAMTEGATGYIQKPIRPDILEASLSEYIVSNSKFAVA